MKERINATTSVVSSLSSSSSSRHLTKVDAAATGSPSSPPPSNNPVTRHQHRIDLKNSHCDAASSSATPEHDGEDHRQCLSPLLSPTLSETSSVSSSLSPVPSSKKYQRKEKIGQGAQGSVYRCIEVATGKEVAVKVIMTHELSPIEIEAIKREVKTIKKLHHRHLVQYYKATEKKTKQLSIYMEFVAGGSLSAKLRHDGALALPIAKRFTRQLCEALQHLHHHRITHRDIKCANIFLTSSREELKLGDFGAFKEVGSVSLVGGLKGTPHWMAPEVIRAEQHTSEDGWFKADIWSLGCAVIEMLTGHSPWQQYSNPLTAMYQIVSSNNTPTIPADATEETASFLKLCLQRNPEERASITALLQHPFVQSVVESETNDVATEQQQQQQQQPEKQAQPETKPIRKTTKVKSLQMNHADHTDERHEPSRKTQISSPMRLRKATAAAAAATATTTTPEGTALAGGDPIHLKEAVRTGLEIESTSASAVVVASPTPPALASRPSIRKPSIVPRLKPIELIKSPNNQDKEHHHHHRHNTNNNQQPGEEATTTPVKPMKPMPPSVISRGVSASALGAPLPRIDSKTTSGHGISITPVRLRRLSTAPAASRDPEDILSSMPTVHKLKLPPLSARPASSSATGSSSDSSIGMDR